MWFPSFIPRIMDYITGTTGGRKNFRRKTIRFWMTHRLRRGFFAELKAARYLQNKGLTILERNYFNELGEIDLIAQENSVIVFVEVKASIGKEDFHPASFVKLKQRKRIK